MRQLFESEYMEILTNPMQGILEVDIKRTSESIEKFDEHIAIINQYIKDTKNKKLIFKLNKLLMISKESIIKDKLIPFIGEQGIKDIAIITGENIKVKSLISELDNYLKHEKEQYGVSFCLFEQYDQALQWINFE
jgi:hypothetical protein